jgi:hypothetical protein
MLVLNNKMVQVGEQLWLLKGLGGCEYKQIAYKPGIISGFF